MATKRSSYVITSSPSKPRAIARRWSAKDLLVLRRLAGKEPLWRIAQTLGRSELGVRWKAKKECIPLGWGTFRKPP